MEGGLVHIMLAAYLRRSPEHMDVDAGKRHLQNFQRDMPGQPSRGITVVVATYE